MNSSNNNVTHFRRLDMADWSSGCIEFRFEEHRGLITKGWDDKEGHIECCEETTTRWYVRVKDEDLAIMFSEDHKATFQDVLEILRQGRPEYGNNIFAIGDLKFTWVLTLDCVNPIEEDGTEVTILDLFGVFTISGRAFGFETEQVAAIATLIERKET